MWNGFWRYRYLLWNLVSRDFKLKYRRSVLGVVWSVLNPLLMCLVYWAVFSSLMDMRGSGIDNFAVFLMCGQLLFNFFNEATSTSMSSVLSAAPLLKKVYIPKYIFPLEKCCFAMVNCIFSFVCCCEGRRLRLCQPTLAQVNGNEAASIKLSTLNFSKPRIPVFGHDFALCFSHDLFF